VNNKPVMSQKTLPVDVAREPSYEALLKAVWMMGFHPQKLADFVSSDADHTCKAILLACLDVSDEKLHAAGASSPDKWRAVLAGLRGRP
jgi:hypothetical protein